MSYAYEVIENEVELVVKMYAGYTIPAGWTLMVANSALHLNPGTHKDPLDFNPWRWKVY